MPSQMIKNENGPNTETPNKAFMKINGKWRELMIKNPGPKPSDYVASAHSTVPVGAVMRFKDVFHASYADGQNYNECVENGLAAVLPMCRNERSVRIDAFLGGVLCGMIGTSFAVGFVIGILGY